ncbi:hypothetical protein D9611_007355 [Ephemerocybe angulata]|uniref:BTB domain-containing protein n=1 Tax=Ephemerocybe angulata TaxID=980116 RepID=A0A8H5CFD8_9AGAR|nr:hypothetical protein D9611_007355 [Tulosesus angulatus]
MSRTDTGGSPALKRRRVVIEEDDERVDDDRYGDPSRSVTDRELARNVSAPTTEPAPVIRSDLWFEDGSVVLQVQDVQFKVHRTIVARHSPIFLDVFAMPHPQDEPTVEGCPVLHLQDSVQDVRHMLLAFYDKGHSTRDPLAFDAVAAMIRMGRKYDIDYLRHEALLRLTTEFPTTLSEWDKLPHDYTQIHHQSGILFDIVNLAHDNDIKSVLPAAYYLCIQEFEDLLTGTARDDESVAQVSYDVKRECILGRERLFRAQTDHLFGWVDNVGCSDKCTQPARCRAAGSSLIKALYVPMPEPARTLERWIEFKQFVPMQTMALCQVCSKDAERAHEEGRQQIWNNLPSYFGLPGWSSLKNFDG